MNALLDRVPADIDGLVRVGSPLFHRGARCVCREVSLSPLGTLRAIRYEPHYFDHGASSFALDLTDAVGRADAEAWIRTMGRRDPCLSSDESVALTFARRGIRMTPEQIDTIARLVYRAAGRLP
jgi:hypothetical protein